MPIPLEVRRSRSAQHYLIEGPITGRLEALLSLVSQAVDFPIVRVNIVDEDTQHTIRLFGAGDPAAVARYEAFCDTVVRTGRPVLVDDATADPRFADFSSVTSGQIGSYLGVPLIGRESMVIGAICVIDPEPRMIGGDQLERLTEFGKVVEDQLDLIRRLQEQRLEGDVATADVARAVHDGEIVPWYQPVIDLDTGETLGYEALARWEHPVRGIDDPRRFVPVAEDSDLIIEVDLAIIRRAVTDLKSWQTTHPSLRVSVNLSARHLTNPGGAAVLNEIVASAGVTPSSVDLELTETTRIDPGDARIPLAVHELRQCGFKVWLDDFGAGWSSLDQLLWLLVDGIKIDRAVAVALGTPVGDALTLAVTGLAAALGLRTTIEGIETEHHAHLARALGCDNGQGYLWARAEPAAAIARTLARLPPPSPPEDGRTEPVRRGTARRIVVENTDSSPTVGRPPPAEPPWSAETALAGAVLEALPDATAVLDHTGMIIAVNHTWRMFALDNGGNGAATGVGVGYLDVCARSAQTGCADAAHVADHLRAVLTGQCIEAELEYPCPSPSVERWFLIRITRLSGPTPGVVISHINISRRKSAEDEHANAASHDPLTGLANRTLLNRRLTTALGSQEASSRDTWGVGVLYIDLDRFKPVNDTYGHGAGDEVLLTVGHRLRDTVRPGDTIGRLGGDEFAIIAPRTDEPGLAALGARIDRSLAEPHRVHGHLLDVHGSIGTYLAHPGENPDEALHAADRAMYADKRSRHGPSVGHQPDIG